MTHFRISSTARSFGLRKPEGESKRYTVHQSSVIGHRTPDGILLWGRRNGGQFVRSGASPALVSVDNFRPMMPGVPDLYRGGRLSAATPTDRAILACVLDAGWGEYGRIYDLRTLGATQRIPDLHVPGTIRVNRPLPAFTSYAGTLQNPEFRNTIREVLIGISEAPGPVYVHCTHGRDRTGIVVMLLQGILGYSDNYVRTEYLKSDGPNGDWLNGFFDHVNRVGVNLRTYAASPDLSRGLGLPFGVVNTLRRKYGR